ncbi:hypothetical protein FRUB_06659 [Fimbriiglobus ruber]|uniref:Uncharacterized protein n=1 Tax=Fimbriiglobus ruber TaxID=1908690 RepID=A0A225DK19_9BACT|nr:hypothetical protein FRUB_06659 [Fimbriiglobus ruber]
MIAPPMKGKVTGCNRETVDEFTIPRRAVYSRGPGASASCPRCLPSVRPRGGRVG